MLKNAARKYRPAPSMAIGDRQWPSRTLTRAPVWCSVDLRDGNQALATPMSPSAKRRFFDLLVRLGFREIEAGFPAASRSDFDFIRQLAEVCSPELAIQVLTTAREEHIEATFSALRGIPRAIVHLYNSTSPAQRRLVFGMSETEVIGLAVGGAARMRALAARRPETEWIFQYSPESFSATEPEFAMAICEAVLAVWEPSPARRAIVNLPASVEVASPNRYADQIEWFSRHLPERESVIVSVHPHNDRGSAVAAAEMALLAGAERVEGALFGNGERTGNVDLVTLALNLYTQGIDPGLDFSDLEEVAACYRQCTGMAISPRHPYAGELVYTAFSGSHQDAIRKGLAAHDPRGFWEVPYLPLDPEDVGRSRDEAIRVNSQSGKAGAGYLLERARGIRLPRGVERAFAREVQRAAEEKGGELSGDEISDLFERSFAWG